MGIEIGGRAAKPRKISIMLLLGCVGIGVGYPEGSRAKKEESPSSRILMESWKGARKGVETCAPRIVGHSEASVTELQRLWRKEGWKASWPQIKAETVKQRGSHLRVDSTASVIVAKPILAEKRTLFEANEIFFLRMSIEANAGRTEGISLDNVTSWTCRIDHEAKQRFLDEKEAKWKKKLVTLDGATDDRRAGALIWRAAELSLYADDFAGAAALLEQVPGRDNRQSVLIQLTRCYWRMGDKAKAADAARRALAAPAPTPGRPMNKHQRELLEFVLSEVEK